MSDKPKRIPLWIKLVVILAVLAAAAVGIQRYLRPVAKVETVISGDAVDAEPGSVTVKEKYSMQMKSAIAGRVLNKDYKLDTGLVVKEGDILVHLDTSDVEVAIEQVQNMINAAKQRMALGSAQKYALESAAVRFQEHRAPLQDGPGVRQRLPEGAPARGNHQPAARPGEGPRRGGPGDG